MGQPQDRMVLVRVGAVVRNGSVIEFSGVVEGSGEQVVGFVPGDVVRGTSTDVFADYVCVPCDSIRLETHE